jgi:hypothetical protein
MKYVSSVGCSGSKVFVGVKVLELASTNQYPVWSKLGIFPAACVGACDVQCSIYWIYV